jgi:LmbE family N-acetylglucosaminyl deacetylase
LTDGCRGSVKCTKDKDLVGIRKNEMLKAHEFLGIDESICLDLEDGKLKADESAILKIRDLVLKIKPDAIYLPTLIDYHSDHLETSKILMLGLKGVDYSGKIITYEINSALIPNIVVDITSCIDSKVKAMKFYESQLAVNDYIYTVIEGLNKYRTNGAMLGKGYAEGFFVCDAKYYQKLMENFFF